MGLLLRCQEVRLSRQAGAVFYCDTIEEGLDWHFMKIDHRIIEFEDVGVT